MFLVGYVARDNRVYVCDKHCKFYSYGFPLSMIEYQTHVLRGDMAQAAFVLPSIPVEQHNRVALFLEKQGLA